MFFFFSSIEEGHRVVLGCCSPRHDPGGKEATTTKKNKTNDWVDLWCSLFPSFKKSCLCVCLCLPGSVFSPSLVPRKAGAWGSTQHLPSDLVEEQVWPLLIAIPPVKKTTRCGHQVGRKSKDAKDKKRSNIAQF